jgi:group II intron reverse transcriptase/maturase
VQEVSVAIVPMKRVTTVKGRAQGRSRPRIGNIKDLEQKVNQLETKLQRIEVASAKDHSMEFKWLIQMCTIENLIKCFKELDGTKAVGIDGVTKEDYAVNLDENIRSLVERMKSMAYFPEPVRGVKIPKANGKFRPLGISNIEDKIVQSLFAKILNAIYEPIFLDNSYGFRRNRDCHDAIYNLRTHLNETSNCTVIDVDLSNFFGTINHRKLIQLLEMKIKDKIFIRYIVRMLRSGVLANGELTISDEGTPQGSIVSPILANIFAHYCLDRWLHKMVKPRTSGQMHFVRYADDLVICADNKDIPRITKSLEGRLKRFSLQMNAEKTKIVNFNRQGMMLGQKQGSFDFLGFTFYIGKTLKSKIVVKLKTSKKTLNAKLKVFTDWCRTNRNCIKLSKFWELVRAKVRGHIQYYGVSFNAEMLEQYRRKIESISFKWLNRRSHRKSYNWIEFTKFLRLFPLPPTKIHHKLY